MTTPKEPTFILTSGGVPSWALLAALVAGAALAAGILLWYGSTIPKEG